MARPDPHRRRFRRAARRSRRFARHAALTLLLDTHVLLWWMAGDFDRIGGTARDALEREPDDALVSAASIWEVAIKRALGKLDAPPDLLQQLERAGVGLLSITARHADRVGSLPPHHRDPFDRLLIAQAMVEGFPLASSDGELTAYDVDLVW